MATQNWGVDRTFKANADLNSYQYYFVQTGSVAGEVKVCATAAASVLGVLQNDPRQGEDAVVRVLGFSKVVANANVSTSTISWGGLVKSGSEGQAYGSVNMAASTYSPGIALQALSSGSGVKIEMLLLPMGRM